MSQRIFVSLEVIVPDGVDPEASAEAVFDWACKSEYNDTGTELVESIDGYDYMVSE
jgi:hypothetical protein